MEILSSSLPSVSLIRFFKSQPGFVFDEDLWSDFYLASSRGSRTRIFVDTVERDRGITAAMFCRGILEEEPDLVNDLANVQKLKEFAPGGYF